MEMVEEEGSLEKKKEESEGLRRRGLVVTAEGEGYLIHFISLKSINKTISKKKLI